GAVAAAVVLAWVLRPLLSREHAAAPSRNAANVAIYRDQLRELDADLAAGTLAREDYERARAEIEARALADVGQPEGEPSRHASSEAARQASGEPSREALSSRRVGWALGAVVPLATLALYFLVGSPSAIDQEVERHPSAAQVEAMVERLAARLRE